MSVFWMSFCDPNLPEGKQFLGVTILRASSLEDAILRSWELKANPGGEVQLLEIPEQEEYRFKPHHFDHLLSLKDLQDEGFEPVRLSELELELESENEDKESQ